MRFLIIVFLFALPLIQVNAQIRSGSFRINGDLNQINVSANADFGKFRTDMSAGYNIAEDKIDYYHAEFKMAPSDIYFALELSRTAQRPVDDVIRVYRIRKSNGWGEIAKELGIKPGSPEFHALKNSAGKKSAKYKGDKGPKGSKGKGQGGHGKGKDSKNK
jgi:hypothetical protein